MQTSSSNKRPIRVLIVDDSAIVRKVLSDVLSAEPGIEVVGTAPDPIVARDKMLALDPDVMTLDIEMPRMDGLTFLEKVMRFHPLPVIIVSSLAQSSTSAALEALQRGAVDALAKPGGPYSVGDLREDLPRRVRAAASAKLAPPRAMSTPATPVRSALVASAGAADAKTCSGGQTSPLIAIGASTGGTQAIEAVLREMPAGVPPIVIAQHIPPVFSKAFADRLNNVCAIRVKEAEDNESLQPGTAYVAPGNHHLVVERIGRQRWRGHLHDGEKVCYQRPSVDVLMHSVASAAKDQAFGIILTGMGKDGAEGLLAMRQAGARTIAQDEPSCVVFGMPREAIERGAAANVMPLSQIGPALVRAVCGSESHSASRPALEEKSQPRA